MSKELNVEGTIFIFRLQISQICWIGSNVYHILYWFIETKVSEKETVKWYNGEILL